MSYILDALRKSDQQRRRGGVPSLPTMSTELATAGRPAMRFYGVLAGLVIIAVAWMRPWLPEPAVVPSIALPALQSPSPQLTPSPLPERSTKVEPTLLRYEAPPAIPAPTVPAVRRNTSAAKLVTHREPSAGIVARPEEAVAAAVAEQAAASASAGISPSLPVTSSEMPLAIRRALPVMSIAVHAYSNTPRDRLVSINGRMLREGDSLAPDLRLEQITPEGMIFTYRGHRFQRAAQ